MSKSRINGDYILATAGYDNLIQLFRSSDSFDEDFKPFKTLSIHNLPVFSLEFSHNGRYLYSYMHIPSPYSHYLIGEGVMQVETLFRQS